MLTILSYSYSSTCLLMLQALIAVLTATAILLQDTTQAVCGVILMMLNALLILYVVIQRIRQENDFTISQTQSLNDYNSGD